MGIRARLEANSFETLIAALCLLTAVSFFLVPGYLKDAPIGQAAPLLRYAWVVMLGGSSFGILLGLAWGRAHFEVAGLLLLSSASAIQTLALADTLGFESLTSIGVFLAVAWSCLMRARAVWKFSELGA